MSFFDNSKDVNASHGVFNNVGGDQHNNNHTRNIGPQNGTFVDSSVNQEIRGPHSKVTNVSGNVYNHRGSVHRGDSYYGPIYGSNVGGRNNTNIVTNGAFNWPAKERQAPAQLNDARGQRVLLAQQRVEELNAELAAVKAELAKLNNPAE